MPKSAPTGIASSPTRLLSGLCVTFLALSGQALGRSGPAVASEGPARLFMRDGVRILYLEGSAAEMAYQHGRLVRDVMPDSAVVAAAAMVPNAARGAASGSPWTATGIMLGVKRFITRPIIESSKAGHPLAQNFLEVNPAELARGSGLPKQTLLDAALSSESYMVVAKLAMQLGHFPFLGSNCTSFSAWGSRTPDGELVIGRNLDFPLNGSFDRFPAVLYMHPTAPGAQRIAAVTSAGVHNPGITAINESGIFLGLHTIPTDDAGAAGVSIFIVAAEVLAQARTFDEALAIFSKYRPPVGWTYHLASTRERKVGSVELSLHGMGVRMAAGDYHVQTNHYMTPEQRGKMLAINRSVDADSEARYTRADQVLGAAQGAFDEQAAAALLGDHTDPFTGTVRSVGRTISVHTTVSSVVIRPSVGRIYVATGQAPVATTPFIALPLPGDFDPARFADQDAPAFTATAFRTQHPGLQAAVEAFVAAKRAFEERQNEPEATARLDEALALDPGNPHFLFIAGILRLRAGDLNGAAGLFDRLAAAARTRHERHLAAYYLGRIAGHRGLWSDAMAALATITTDGEADGKLQKAATEALKLVEKQDSAGLKPSKLAVMFQQADMEQY